MNKKIEKEIEEKLKKLIGTVGRYAAYPVLNDEKATYTYACYASGDGMINAGIQTDDLLLLEYTETLLDGEIGAFFVDGYKPMIKRFFHDRKHRMYILQYEDGKQAPILINDDDSTFQILGRLISVVKKVGRERS